MELKFAASDTSSPHTSPRYLQSRGVRHRSYRYGYRHRHGGSRLHSHALLRSPIVARSYRMPSDRCSSSGTGIPHYQDPKLPPLQGECISQWVELCIGLTQVPFVNPIGDLKRCMQEEVLGKKKVRGGHGSLFCHLFDVVPWSPGDCRYGVYLHFQASSPGCLLFFLHGYVPQFICAVLCGPGRALREWRPHGRLQDIFISPSVIVAPAALAIIHILSTKLRVQIPQEMCGFDQTPNPDQASL